MEKLGYLVLSAWLSAEPDVTKNAKLSTLPEKHFQPSEILLYDDPLLKMLPPDFEPPPATEWDKSEEISETEKQIEILKNKIIATETEISLLKNSIAEMRSLEDTQTFKTQIHACQHELRFQLKKLHRLQHLLRKYKHTK